MSLSEDVWQNKENFFEKGLISHSCGLLSLCISAVKNENGFWKTLKILLWMFITFLYCFKKRYELDHNQLNILNRFLLKVYQKVGHPISGMINLFIDLDMLSCIEQGKAERYGNFYQIALAYITNAQILIAISSIDQKRIRSLLQASIEKIANKTPKEINEFSEKIRIVKLIAIVYFDLKDRNKDEKREEIKKLLEEAIQTAEKYEINSQIKPLKELLEKIQKEMENTAK